MSLVFISYDNRDREIALLLRSQLQARNVSSVFLDVGTQPGLKWERELYRSLRSSRALLALSSRHSLESKWFFAEVTQARAMGKSIFPVLLDDAPIHELLRDRQAVRFARDAADYAADKVVAGLRSAGLVDQRWDSSRPPYPGLLHFDEADAGVFFGREELINEALSRLTAMRRNGGPRWLLLFGASGCGKSSLLRAGVLPHLRQDDEQWIVVGPFTRGKSSAESIALAFDAAFERCGRQRDAIGILRDLQGDNTGTLVRLGSELRVAARRPSATVLLVVDQLEELLNEDDGDAASDAILRVLRSLSCEQGAPFLILASLRSDFLGDFQNHPALRDLNSDELTVKPLEEAKLPLVIEGPARLAGVELEAGLVDEIVRDTKTEDALPLLAYALRELYERFGGDGLLELRKYREQLGGLQRAVAARADEVLCRENKALSREAQQELRAAFLSMLRLTEAGLPARRRLRWAEVPKPARRALQAFVDARLLVSGGEDGEAEVTVAHEALFRSWPILRGWIEENREFLAWRKRLDPLVEEWWRAGRDSEALLRGPALGEARLWLSRARGLFSNREASFIEASAVAERRRRRNLRVTTSAVGLALGTFAAVSVWQLEEATRAKRGEERARKLAEEERYAAEAGRAEAKEQARRARNGNLLAASRNAEPSLAALLIREVEPPAPVGWVHAAHDIAGQTRTYATLAGHEGAIQVAVFSPDGKRVLTGSSDGTARVWSTDGGDPLVLYGHKDSIAAAVFSPDGERVLTGSNDGTARVWSAGRGDPLVLSGHWGWVVTASFSPDGKRVLTGSLDGTARVWSANGGEPLILSGHENGVVSAVFGPDGKRVLTGSLDGTARVWSADGGDPVVLSGHERGVASAMFSPDGKRVLTGSYDGTARVWSANGGDPVVLSGHEDSIVSAVFSPDGESVLTGSLDGTARVWSADGGRPVVLSGHERGVVTAMFSPDVTRVLTGSYDGTARVWSLDGGDPVLLSGHENGVVSAVFSPDGKRVVTGSYDGTARVWIVNGGDAVVLSGHKDLLVSAVFSPDGKRVLTGSRDGTARLWSAEGRDLLVLSGHKGSIVSAVFSPDGTRVLTGSDDGTARVWSADGGDPVVLLGHRDSVVSAVFSPDGTRVLTGSDDGTARVWSAEGRDSVVLSGHKDSVVSAAFSPDGKRVLTGSDDGTVRVWSAGGGDPVVLPGDIDFMVSAVFSPDGKRVLIGSGDGKAWVWSAEGGDPIVLSGHKGPVVSAVFSPEGSRVLTGSRDGTARVWSAEGGDPIVLSGHKVSVETAVFSSDGKLVVTGSFDGTAKVWSAEGGDPLAVLSGHESGIVSAVFSPDGKRVLTASYDGTARVWDWDLRTRLWREAIACPTVEQRQNLLLMSALDGDRDWQRCRETVQQCQTEDDVCREAIDHNYGPLLE